MGTIQIKEMLVAMETGEPFSIQFITFDRKRKTGGDIKEFSQAILCYSKKTTNNKVQARPMTRIEQMTAILETDTIRRNPNHKSNYTRNIQILQDGHPTAMRRKIHPLLVTQFNTKTVLT